MGKNRLMLHVCCAPCTVGVLEPLRHEGWQVTALWYNPNIHPPLEHKRREKTFLTYAASVDLPVIRPFDYEINDFFRRVVYREQIRCRFCYHMRLERTAALATSGEYDAFASTLMLSPHQDHELLQSTGSALADGKSVEYCYIDLRDRFDLANNQAEELGLYCQNYCGCIYSSR